VSAVGGVASSSSSAAPATTAPSAAGTGAVPPGVRLPSSRIDFRSLLREDAPAREPALGMAMTPPGAAAAASPRPLLPASNARGGLAKVDGEEVPRAVPAADDDPLDPLSRHRASLGPPDALFSPPPATLASPAPFAAGPTPLAEVATTRAAASLEDLLPELVRRVAWSGDGRRGTMRLEIGSGKLAGSTLLVHADAGRVRVRLDVPPDVDASGWQERISRRLEARGIPTDSVEVT
jgi:hypothetical protein